MKNSSSHRAWGKALINAVVKQQKPDAFPLPSDSIGYGFIKSIFTSIILQPS